MEAAEAVDSATPSPTSLLQNSETDPSFAQLPQDAAELGKQGDLSLLGNPETARRLSPKTLFIPLDVFEGFPSELNAFIRRELYQMTRAAKLCWNCRRPTGGPALCEEHRKKAVKSQVRSARRLKREARERKIAKKLGKTENVLETLEAFLTVKKGKR
jgi:hypothetical protein